MLKKLSVFSTLAILIGIGIFSNVDQASGQIQNLDCPNCITIPEGQIGLYKELFPLVVWTDHTTYDHNSIIVVHGWVKEQLVDIPVTVNVFNPIGNVISVGQTSPGADGTFEFQFNTAGQLWKADGSYIIKVQSGIESRVFKTKVDLIPTSVGVKNACGLYEITASADNGGKYCLPYNVKNGVKGIDAYLYTQTKTLELKPRTFGVGQFTIDIPRDVLDSKSGNNDTPFTVLLNGKPYKYDEGDPKSDQVRRLQFEVPIPISGNRDKIEVIGTTVIPEFGTIAIMILVASIASILVVTRRTSIRAI